MSNRNSLLLIQKFQLLWTSWWRLSSFLTSDETMNSYFWWVSGGNRIWELYHFIEYQVVVFLLVVIASHSSSVEKDGSSHQNVHSDEWNLWITYNEFLFDIVLKPMVLLPIVLFTLHALVPTYPKRAFLGISIECSHIV